MHLKSYPFECEKLLSIVVNNRSYSEIGHSLTKCNCTLSSEGILAIYKAVQV